MLARVNKGGTNSENWSFLCAERIGLNVKGKFYEACVRSCMIYGGETWAISVEFMRKLEKDRNENAKADVCCQIARQIHEGGLAEQI